MLGRGRVRGGCLHAAAGRIGDPGDAARRASRDAAGYDRRGGDRPRSRGGGAGRPGARRGLERAVADPEALPAERRAAIVAALEEAEIADVRVEALPFAVTTTRVGYYLEADRGAAEALARLVGLLSAGATIPGP